MKYSILFIVGLVTIYSYSQMPKGFVYVKDVIPDVEVDLRYTNSNNFVGKPIEGYNNTCLILSEAAVKALVKVQDALKERRLGLKIFDGYRPQRAVNHFIKWAKALNDTVRKQQFYPDVKKQNLFKEEYIASRSGHTKGSTVDLTLIDLNTNSELDMGSPFDFFGKASWVNYTNITEQQKQNRALLQEVMRKYGFKNYAREWWHFTLKNEPFPRTYFDFPIE